MLQVFITAAVFYIALVVLMYVLQRNFLYYPENFTPTPAQSYVPEMEEVRFTTEDGLELFAWVAPPSLDAKPSLDSKPWVVLFHGNAGSVGSRGFKARVFLDAGYGVMLAEYRGYGGNPGTPSEAGLMSDARAALAYLAGHGGAGQSLVLYGESLGTGMAVAMAAEAAERGNPVAAVVLEAPYTTIPDVAAAHYPFLPVRLLMKDHYDNLSRIARVNAPVFVIHGSDDWTVPQSLGRKLYGAAVQPKDALWVDGDAHNDLFGPRVFQAILEFLDTQRAD